MLLFELESHSKEFVGVVDRSCKKFHIRHAKYPEVCITSSPTVSGLKVKYDSQVKLGLYLLRDCCNSACIVESC
jgi:hypothetical protein